MGNKKYVLQECDIRDAKESIDWRLVYPLEHAIGWTKGLYRMKACIQRLDHDEDHFSRYLLKSVGTVSSLSMQIPPEKMLLQSFQI